MSLAKIFALIVLGLLLGGCSSIAAEKTPSSSGAVMPVGNPSPEPMPVSTQSIAASLTLEEHAIVSDTLDSPLRSGLDYQRRIPAQVLAKHQSLRNLSEGASRQVTFVSVGNDLIKVASDAPNNWQHFTVWRGDQPVYTYTVSKMWSDNPVKGLYSWQGHWVLEIDEQVIMDGQRLSEQLGYAAIFNWQLLDGRPFYYFKQDSHVGISYAGHVLPYQYDEVVHYMCCEPALFNPGGNGKLAWFHARRDGIWYYVEVGIYKD